MTEFDNALAELEAALAAKTQMILELQGMLKSQGEKLAMVLSFSDKKETLKRQRGRPKKQIDDGWLLAQFEMTQSEFVSANHSDTPSDSKVLKWYFAREFEKHGIVQTPASLYIIPHRPQWPPVTTQAPFGGSHRLRALRPGPAGFGGVRYGGAPAGT